MIDTTSAPDKAGFEEALLVNQQHLKRPPINEGKKRKEECHHGIYPVEDVQRNRIPFETDQTTDSRKETKVIGGAK